MRLNGDWSLCDDRIVRPVIRAEVLANDGSWVRAELLVDTGADRTVLSASIWMLLGLPPVATHDRISGVGGLADTVVVETRIRLSRDDGGRVTFHGRYAAVTEGEALDMSVLGRDIAGLFAVVVDRSGNVVCLLSQRHRYLVEQQ